MFNITNWQRKEQNQYGIDCRCNERTAPPSHLTDYVMFGFRSWLSSLFFRIVFFDSWHSIWRIHENDINFIATCYEVILERPVQTSPHTFFWQHFWCAHFLKLETKGDLRMQMNLAARTASKVNTFSSNKPKLKVLWNGHNKKCALIQYSCQT